MNSTEEKFLFPFQYLEKYLLEESDLDSAIDNTIDEVYRIIEGYIKESE